MSHEFHAATVERPQQSSIEIVFADHSEANLLKVAETVIASDGDIIAIEKIREGSFGMGTAEYKADLSARMTKFIAPDSTIAESASEYFGTNEPFFTTVLDRLRGTGKQIVLIDMGTDNPGYFLRQNSRAAAQAVELLNDGTLQDTDENRQRLHDLMIDYQIASAQENEYREHTMRNQLLRLASDNPGKKITAMIGATHTWISHHLPKTVNASRMFVPTDEGAVTYEPTEKIRFDRYPYNGTRMLRFNLERFGMSVFDPDGNLIEPHTTKVSN